LIHPSEADGAFAVNVYKSVLVVSYSSSE